MGNTKKIENSFKNKSLYELALTHKSWVNEHPKQRTSNERLEFLGDAILEFIVSKEIFNKFPDKEEGYLTALRANLVNTVNLAKIAQKLNLGEKLFLSKGEEETGGRTNPSLLADTVEALIGALFIDKGLSNVQNFISDYILIDLEETVAKPLKDSKSLLQEYVQSKGYPAPRYDVIQESGPDHNKWFKIKAAVNGNVLGEGEGKNKGEAAQNAAKNALDKISNGRINLNSKK